MRVTLCVIVALSLPVVAAPTVLSGPSVKRVAARDPPPAEAGHTL